MSARFMHPMWLYKEMKISEIYKKKRPLVSLEIFPPKKSDSIELLYKNMGEFAELNPDFISVTYSAGGTGSSDETVKIASHIKNTYNIETLVHLTCINSSMNKTVELLDELKNNGIENILALRGDLIENINWQKEYSFAKDLICHIKTLSKDFCLGAAAYPEGHIDCDNFELSLAHLKEKVECGADFLITQLFFDNDIFYRFFDSAKKMNINVPISAGIMPILSKGQIDKMIYMCGVSLPAKIVRMLNKYKSEESLKKAGIEYSVRQINDLIANGVDGVHIYTMNHPDIARENAINIKVNKK